MPKTKNMMKRLLLGAVFSLPLFNVVSCSSGHFMDISLEKSIGCEEKSNVIISTIDGVKTLDNMSESKTISSKEHTEKCKQLKKNVQGFTPAQTHKIHQYLDVLFSIQDKDVQKRLSEVSNNITIRPPLPQDGFIDSKKCNVFFAPSTHSVVLPTDKIETLCPVEMIVSIGHELDHARKNKLGLTKSQYPAFMDNERFISFSMIDEADTASYEQHLKMCVGDYLKYQGKLDVPSKTFLMQDRDLVQYRQMYEAALNESPSLLSPVKQAQGRYMKDLLHGGSVKFTSVYLHQALDELNQMHQSGVSLSDKPNEDLARYVYASYANQYGLTLQDLEKPVDLYLNVNKGKLLKQFEKFERNYTSQEVKHLKQSANEASQKPKSTLKKQLSTRTPLFPAQARKQGGR